MSSWGGAGRNQGNKSNEWRRHRAAEDHRQASALQKFLIKQAESPPTRQPASSAPRQSNPPHPPAKQQTPRKSDPPPQQVTTDTTPHPAVVEVRQSDPPYVHARASAALPPLHTTIEPVLGGAKRRGSDWRSSERCEGRLTSSTEAPAFKRSSAHGYVLDSPSPSPSLYPSSTSYGYALRPRPWSAHRPRPLTLSFTNLSLNHSHVPRYHRTTGSALCA